MVNGVIILIPLGITSTEMCDIALKDDRFFSLVAALQLIFSYTTLVLGERQVFPFLTPKMIAFTALY